MSGKEATTRFIRTLLLLNLQVYYIATAPLPYVCHHGNYLHTPRIGPEFCLPCPEGVSFMPESLHRNRQCYNCTQVLDPSVEVVVSVCNRTHDSVILCREGYYRQVARNVREVDRCVTCSFCDHVTRPCQGYHDAVCCLPSYEAVWNKNGFFECKERPIVCGAGEFLSLKTEQCTPCPSGTFMTSDKHNHTNCQVCQTLNDVGPHQQIVQPCNITHPSQFACQDGFFRDRSLELKETHCVPCQTCEGEGGQCSRSHNSSQELICLFLENATEGSVPVNYTVISVTHGSPPLSVCGENEYLFTYSDNNETSTCLPRPDGTHPDDVNHTKLVCENETSEIGTQTSYYYIFLTFIIIMLILTSIIFSLWGRSIFCRLKGQFFSHRTFAKHKILSCLTLIYFFVLINVLLVTSAFYLSNLFLWVNVAVGNAMYILNTVILFAINGKKITKMKHECDISKKNKSQTDTDNTFNIVKEQEQENYSMVNESLLTIRTYSSDENNPIETELDLVSNKKHSTLTLSDTKCPGTDNFPNLSNSKQQVSLRGYLNSESFEPTLLVVHSIRSFD